MDRIIKFRGFTKNEEKFKNGKDGWIYGNLSILDDGTVYIQDINDDNWFKAVFEESVGQFTGLYDKNGKEIYDSDIIHIEDDLLEDFNYLIKWNPEYLRYYLYSVDKENLNKIGGILEAHLGSLETEVIGNIYDNKNLLEEE